jgi:hypothetical protein
MNVLDLFSGIGGFSLGLERAGMRTVAFCEIDPFCRASSPSTGLASLSTTTSEHSPESSRACGQMSYAEAFRARTSAQPDRVSALTASARTMVASTPDLLANFDRATSSWKTSQTLLVRGLTEFSETWPRSGMTRSGTAYLLPPLVPIIGEIVSGSLPTPTAQGVSRFTSAGGSNARKKWAKMLPDMTAHDYRGGCKPERSERMREQSARGLDLPSVLRLLFPDSTGLVRPSWAEARMGYPIGWTECTPLETPSSRKSRKSSGAQTCCRSGPW